MWEDRVAVHVKKDFDMLKSQMWRNSYFGKILLADLLYIVYKYCFFRFDASRKDLFVNCHRHVLFISLAPMIFKGVVKVVSS